MNPDNGSINFYHGTQKLGLAPHVELPGVAPQVDPGVLKRIDHLRVKVDCPAGSGALFSGYTIHWSGPNTGDRNRPAITIGIRGRNTTIKSEEENIASMLARHFREEIGVPTITRDDDFYDLGGQDTQAERILDRVRREYDVVIPLADFSRSYRTPNALAARVVELQAGDASGAR